VLSGSKMKAIVLRTKTLQYVNRT